MVVVLEVVLVIGSGSGGSGGSDMRSSFLTTQSTTGQHWANTVGATDSDQSSSIMGQSQAVLGST